MEPNKDEESSEQHLRVGRGLDQVSHLFLSHVAERAARGRSGNGSELPEHAQENQPLELVRRAPRAPDRERLVSLLHEQPEALKEGLKVIDADLPCETPASMLRINPMTVYCCVEWLIWTGSSAMPPCSAASTVSSRSIFLFNRSCSWSPLIFLRCSGSPYAI